MNRSVIKTISHLDRCIRCHAYGKQIDRKALNLTQFQILIYLLKNEDKDVCQKDLEDEIHLKKASITANLDALENKDLIRREPGKTDRRKKYLKLSEKTKSFARLMEEKARNYDQKIIAGIPKEELDVFFRVSGKICENIMEGENETDL
ncbi:MAG: MarR family transcriptional regulator [Erysipelotrichaceae bacterium]|nr:MarR family transcriptional regulator [Erysipelotrichaceae bacterium]